MADNQNNLCRVGNYHQIEKESIRQTVCHGLPIEDDGYCLLHSPRPEKDQQRFEEIFRERIRLNDSYFEAVIFPIPLDFNHYEFKLPLNFSRATFLSHVTLYDIKIKYIYFDRAEFHAFTHFHNCLFGEIARFSGAVFKREAWFMGSHFKESTFDHATFNGHTQFNNWARFTNAADFSSAKFSGITEFDTATFESSVSFDEAEFDANSQVSLRGTSFQQNVTFKKTVFKGYLNLEDAGTREVFGDNSSLSLRNARLEAPEKLSFHSVRLRPHWFLDADSRKIAFANIRWKSEKGIEINAKDELSRLENSNNANHYQVSAFVNCLPTASREFRNK